MFRSVDYNRPFVKHSLHRFYFSMILYYFYLSVIRIVKEELLRGRSLDFTELSGGLDLESALIYDAVHLLAVALGHLRYKFLKINVDLILNYKGYSEN